MRASVLSLFIVFTGLCIAGELRADETRPTALESTSKMTRVSGRVVLRAAYGEAFHQLAGAQNDPLGLSDGFPPAFDVGRDGRIHVLDGARGRVVVFDGEGTFVEARPLGLGKGKRLSDLSVAADGSMAVMDLDADGVWIFPPSMKEKPSFVGGLEGAQAIRLGAERRLWVQREDQVLMVGPQGELELALVEEGVRPWSSAGAFLYGCRFVESGNEVEITRLDLAKGLSRSFATLSSPFAGASPLAVDILGVRPDGSPVIVLLVGRSLSKEPDPSDQRLEEKKYALLLDGTGSVETIIPLWQATVSCRITPRFHHIGADGHLYTARPGKRAYALMRHDLPSPSSP